MIAGVIVLGLVVIGGITWLIIQATRQIVTKSFTSTGYPAVGGTSYPTVQRGFLYRQGGIG